MPVQVCDDHRLFTRVIDDKDLMKVLCINDTIESDKENKLAVMSAAWTEDEYHPWLSMVPLQLSA